ncbi:type I-E CRISPR-associated protein Cas5/CasD [Methylobacterium nodulans]|uniref:CRISPR-associated protein Cas5 family n=1 Tax=Methylobacterium nodulans (strain LMG 21967 / CNCM I-2342 / ORS 2060) TaxID=460265 RepID=B8IJS9_METNO|nr:type I-E CRISPR-associated protein Cas5/CasD [Methylobacterium nodulans]ACL58127.1 CRISPR-associated protein Cas5 family [Methylobacterium nodulans ORS 2060]
MREHLLLLLEAPLQAWGGVLVDAYGPVDEFPAATLVGGLVANALGYDRADWQRLEALQERLVVGAAVLRRGSTITDNQNAKLEKGDVGWTTRGRPEGRGGGAEAYKSPHRRFRDYHADTLALVALRLDPEDEKPDLDAIAHTLEWPERPLFLGRKPCLPSRSIVWPERMRAETLLKALNLGAAMLVAAESANPKLRLELDAGPWRARWPEREGNAPSSRLVEVCDDRDFRNDVPVGLRRRRVGTIGEEREHTP